MFQPYTKEFQLRGKKMKEKSKGIPKVGKKTQEWNDARKELVQIFKSHGITKCELKLEGCWKTVHGFAHRDKRRNLSVDDLMLVAAACNNCHDKIEYMPHEEMTKIIDKIVTAHDWV